MKEIESLRKEREKHYRKKDGTFEVKFFNEDIHYQKDKLFFDIEKTLKEEKNIFKNETNTFKITFQKKEPTCKVYNKDSYAQISWQNYPTLVQKRSIKRRIKVFLIYQYGCNCYRKTNSPSKRRRKLSTEYSIYERQRE